MSKEADQLRDLGDDELAEKFEEAKEELFNLRFQLVTGQLDNPTKIGATRKQVARILTIMRERELDALEAESATAAGEA